MTPCYEMENEEDMDKEKWEKPSKSDDKILTILEALLACMDWK